MDEKRKSIRIDSTFKVSYKVISPPDGHGGTASHNISEGGICIPCSTKLLTGMVLELGISMVNYAKPIQATGEIIWIDEKDDPHFPYVMGIRFLNIDPSDKDRVFHYIRNKIRKERKSDLEWIE